MASTATAVRRAAPPTNGSRVPRATAAVETVSPKTAAKYLGYNVTNRKLRPHRVAGLMGILQRNEWELTGDALVFDVNGYLINGQHRLTAVIESGISADFVVLRGVPAKTQDVMDRGLPRSLADSLKLRGYGNVNVLSSSINWLARLDYVKKTGAIHYAEPGDRPTTTQALRLLEKHKDLPDYVRASQKVRATLKLRHGMVAALWFEFAKLDADQAAVFFDTLESGAEFALGKNDPVYLLRRALMTDIGAVRRMQDYRQAALICKAWNYWREGRSISSLAWKFGGTQREEFPIPV